MTKIKNQIKSLFFFSQAGTWSLSLPKGYLVTKNQLKLIRPLSSLCDGVSIPTLTTLSLLLCLVISSCNKTSSTPPTSLPAYSENGSNVVACRVNGRVYVSGKYYTNREGTFNPIDIDTRVPNSLDILSAAWYDKNQEFVNLILNTYKKGVDKSDEIRYHNDMYLRNTTDFYFRKDRKPCSIIILKNDTINRIIAGKFNAILFNKNDSLHLATDSTIITDGTFDIKY
jgi:hypothetical protein